MQIAQVLSGYTLGGADLLRRAMGKKKPEEMAKQREIFVGTIDRTGPGVSGEEEPAVPADEDGRALRHGEGRAQGREPR